MRWSVRLSTVVTVEAETTGEAVELARERIDPELARAADLRVEVIDMDGEERPSRFPQYSRTMLETLYIDSGAAMRQAALEALPDSTHEERMERVGEWITKSQNAAAAVKRNKELEAYEGTKQ